jgi:NADPH:quinone reductase-like Zn-dependent oxidoreductase
MTARNGEINDYHDENHLDRHSMKAIRYYRYGSADVLELEDIAKPVIGDSEVLVRVRAASLNPLDLYYLHGLPYIARAQVGLTRPKANGLGLDLAGTVEAVGSNVTRFQPGDDVFGGGSQTLAEYVRVREDGPIVHKPANLTFEQAAAVPVSALTALQALRDKAAARPGQKVLVNGAGGGVGPFAVQIAKALGAEVTGVCSTGNADMVASIGADNVVDYTQEDFARSGKRYDVVVDIAGSRTLSECRRALTPAGVLVGVGAPNKGRWIGPMSRWLKMRLAAPFVRQTMTFFMAELKTDDLAVLGELLQTGKVTPVIDRTYGLSMVPEAIRYLETGHARGKVVITM